MQDSNNLKGALKYSAQMLSELHTSRLSRTSTTSSVSVLGVLQSSMRVSKSRSRFSQQNVIPKVLSSNNQPYNLNSC
jgi:hypothetical protein